MIKKQEVKKNLYSSLKALGLTEQEIELYIVSLDLGPSTITRIAKNLMIARPNIYPLLKSLESHGLAKMSNQKKFERRFIVERPSVVLEKIRQMKKELNNNESDLVSGMPDLLALYSQGERDSKIKIIQGKEQYIKLFRSIIEEYDEIIEFFGSAHDFVSFISWDIENEFIKNRLKKGTFIRILVLPSKITDTFIKKDKQEKRETRIYKGKAHKTSFLIFANKVIMFQPKAPLAILIEDEYIMQMLKSMFYSLWKISK
jgi:sugar-specific transcriptional regulator TrmB